MERLTSAVRYSVGVVALGALLGTAVGLIQGLRLVAANQYLDQAPSLARWVVVDRTSDGMLWGGVIALLVIGAFLLVAAVLRFFLGNWRRAFTGAAFAIPLLGIYLAVAWWINRTLLPGAFSATSIGGNIVLALIAFSGWYMAMRRAGGRSPGSALERTTAWMRPTPIMLMILAVIVVQSTRVIARPDPAQDAPNVLVIVIDALRPDRLGAHGYTRETSPNLDRLASKGWQFMNALSTAPWTKPAIASLLTGLGPRHHGISSAGWNLGGKEGAAASVASLPRALLTLPEVLANAGYRTAAFGENHHLIARLGFDQGFEEHDMELTDRTKLQWIAHRLRLGIAGRFAGDPAERNTTRKINERFLDWLPADDERFFGYLHHIDVHWPYDAPEPHKGFFGPRRTSIDFNSVAFYGQFGPDRPDNDDPPALAPEVVADMSDAYDEGVRFVDAELGDLFAELQRRGLYDRTLIIVTSDHGEQFLEHGEIGHGTSLHDVLLRIPLIVKFPCPGEYCAPRTVAEQVQLVDVMPTVLDLVGLPIPNGVSGLSLIDPLPKERVLFAEQNQQVALRTSDFKFIYHLDDSHAELYALQRDPGERQDLSKNDPKLAFAFRDRVFQWLEEIEQNAPAPREEVAADSAMLERLKALGYLK